MAAYAVDCACRKPQPGMILQALQDLSLSAADSLLVGDKRSDIDAGRAAGLGRLVLVRSGQDLSPEDQASADAVHESLADFVDHLLG